MTTADNSSSNTGAGAGVRRCGVDLLLLVVPLCTLTAFVAVLGLAAFIVHKTGDTKGLRDLAVLIRAFRPSRRILRRCRRSLPDVHRPPTPPDQRGTA
ncbi:hypothetical protein ACFPN7_27715 [Amycolatopsis halotolerans]|uniref:hypothetical protein n=1 Tax=Amycolatopsis halotolerans TaxID=330083 RepID=UPI00361D7A60